MTAPQYWFDPLLDQTTWGDPEFSPGAWFDTEALGVIGGEGAITSAVEVLSTGTVVLDGIGAIAVLISVLGAGEGIVAPSPTTTVQPSGGWVGGFDSQYERELRHRAQRRREQQALEAETESIKEAVDREIAQLLRRQEAEDQKRQELERLRGIADTLSAEQARRDYGQRVERALARAIDAGSFSALAALDRELQRARDEEDSVMLAITMIIAED